MSISARPFRAVLRDSQPASPVVTASLLSFNPSVRRRSQFVGRPWRWAAELGERPHDRIASMSSSRARRWDRLPAVVLATVRSAPGTTSVPNGYAHHAQLIIPLPVLVHVPVHRAVPPNTGPDSVSATARSSPPPPLAAAQHHRRFHDVSEVSRTLPAAVLCMSASGPRSNRWAAALAARRHRTKWLPSAGTSSARSRSAGMWNGRR